MVIREKRPKNNCKLCSFGFEDPIGLIKPKDKKDVRNVYDIDKLKDKKPKNLKRDMKTGELVAKKVFYGGKKSGEEEKEKYI